MRRRSPLTFAATVGACTAKYAWAVEFALTGAGMQEKEPLIPAEKTSSPDEFIRFLDRDGNEIVPDGFVIYACDFVAKNWGDVLAARQDVRNERSKHVYRGRRWYFWDACLDFLRWIEPKPTKKEV
jgi:hypothetical protein